MDTKSADCGAIRGCVEAHENVEGRSQVVCVGATDEAGDEAGAGGAQVVAVGTDGLSVDPGIAG